MAGTLIEKTITQKDLYAIIGEQQVIISKLQEAVNELAKKLEEAEAKNG